MKHLLIVYHSKGGKNQQMADAVKKGAQHPDVGEVEVKFLRAAEASEKDLLWSDALILGSPENFGYMSGALKDFFDRTFYEVEGRVDGLPIAIFIGAGNDGQGALMSIRRICNGYKFKEVQAPVIVVGDLDANSLEQCEALGMGMAAGLDAGIF